MSYDIDRVEIYRSEMTQADIDKVEGLSDLLLPTTVTIIAESTGDFALTQKIGSKTNHFHITRYMLEVILKHRSEHG